ncbi:MAG: cupin domain-containing protein [Actinomycetota bacterium]
MDAPFVANVRDLPWLHNDAKGDCCIFEDPEHEFGQIGYTLAVLQPGQGGHYHRELDNQEDFLVLSGECIALLEGEEHRLRAWDFVHCPPGAAHAFVGAGDGPCVILMAGARYSRRYVYLADTRARELGVGVEVETTDPKEAYAGLPTWEPGEPVDL